MTNEQKRIEELEAENLVLRMSLDWAEKEVAIDNDVMNTLAEGNNKQVKELAELRAHLHQIKQEVADMERINRHLAEDHQAQNNHDGYIISKAKMLAYLSMMIRLEQF